MHFLNNFPRDFNEKKTNYKRGSVVFLNNSSRELNEKKINYKRGIYDRENFLHHEE